MEDNNKITPTEEVEKKDEVVEEEKVAPEAEVKEVETKEVLPEAVQNVLHGHAGSFHFRVQ